MKSSLEARGRRVNQTEGMLASHNPKHPLYRRFDSKLKSSPDLTIEWMGVTPDLFGRPVDADVEIVWCWPGSYTWIQHRTFFRVMQKRKPTRFFPLDGGETLLLNQTYGFLRSPESPLMFHLLRFSLPFQFWGSDNFLDVKPPLFQERVEELKTWKGLVEARELICLPSDSWDWLQWKRGSRQELEPLLHSLLVLFAGGFSFELSPKHGLNFHTMLWLETPHGKKHRETFAKVLAECFVATVNPQIPRAFLTSEAESPFHEICLQRLPEQEPSQHERLEALLLWRDFLRDKLPPEEIAALLTPFAT